MTDDPRLSAPLAHLRGERPAAPAWFEAALAHAPERAFVDVRGAKIETLTWGERGRPGLLLLHGWGAHADWWSFIAPFFADRWRVCAISWSGMGGSDRREAYDVDLLIEEALTAAEAAGLFEAEVAPVAVGHSFGGFMTLSLAARRGERLRAAIAVDAPVRSPEKEAERRKRRAAEASEPKPTRLYPTLPDALARFRFAPPQSAEHLFIADHIARGSLAEVERDGERGWTWRFDPFFWKSFRPPNLAADLASPACPLALVVGARSNLISEDDRAFMRATAPAGTPLVVIPEADHHVMVDQPLTLTAALDALLQGWAPSGGT